MTSPTSTALSELAINSSNEIPEITALSTELGDWMSTSHPEELGLEVCNLMTNYGGHSKYLIPSYLCFSIMGTTPLC